MDRIGISGKLCLAAMDHDLQAVDTLASGCSAVFTLVYGDSTYSAANNLVGKNSLVVGVYPGPTRGAFPGAAPESGIGFSDPDLTGLSCSDGITRPDGRTLPLARIFCPGRRIVHRMARAGGISTVIIPGPPRLEFKR